MFARYKSVFERNLPRIANTLKSLKEYCRGEPVIRLLKYIVPRSGLAVDVGANTGTYTYWLRKYAPRVLAVEPNPDCVKLLEGAFGERVKIISGACSASTGSARLNIPMVSGRVNAYQGSIDSNKSVPDECASIMVATFTLDELVTEAVGFVKIDVEGHELDVLQGGRNTLEKFRPVVLVEAEDRHRKGAVEDVFAFFERLDYQCLFYYNGQICSGATFSLSLHQAKRKVRPGARSSAYVNNFLFFPKEKTELMDILRRVGTKSE